jgi:hypothetical protein
MQSNRFMCGAFDGLTADHSQPFERDMGSSNSGDRITANAVPMAPPQIANVRDRRVCVRGFGKA